jgi:hypothetical protein
MRGLGFEIDVNTDIGFQHCFAICYFIIWVEQNYPVFGTECGGSMIDSNTMIFGACLPDDVSDDPPRIPHISCTQL